MYTIPMRVRQFIIQRQQHHKRKKHAHSTQKVPNIMIIVKPQQCTPLIEMSRLRRRLCPRNRLVQKEIHCRHSTHRRQYQKHHIWYINTFPVHNFHADIEEEVEEGVCHENQQQEDCKVFLFGVEAIEGQKPVAYVRDY